MNVEQLQRMLRVQGELATIEALHRENDRYRAALEAARDALADPNAMAEDTDSPANMAFAIVNHALNGGPADPIAPGSAAPSPRKAR